MTQEAEGKPWIVQSIMALERPTMTKTSRPARDPVKAYDGASPQDFKAITEVSLLTSVHHTLCNYRSEIKEKRGSWERG